MPTYAARMPAARLDLQTAAALIEPVDETYLPVDVTPLAGGDNSAVFEVRSDDDRSLVVKT